MVAVPDLRRHDHEEFRPGAFCAREDPGRFRVVAKVTLVPATGLWKSERDGGVLRRENASPD